MTVVYSSLTNQNKTPTVAEVVVLAYGTVFSGYFFKQLREKKINKILLMATGALTNATTNQQGESIPGIAHAIAIENEK